MDSICDSLLSSPYLSGGGGHLYLPFFSFISKSFKNLGLGVRERQEKVRRRVVAEEQEEGHGDEEED